MKKNIIHSTTKTLEGVERTLGTVEKEIQSAIQPLQQNIFRRFPTLFALLVTFGVAITFLAFERIVIGFDFLNTRPWLMLSIGIGVLSITGTLYKKLG